MLRLETISPSALQPFIISLTKRGISAEKYLHRHHIPVELINSADAKIFKQQAYGFFHDVAEQERLSGFGFLNGDPYSIEDLGGLGNAILQAATFKEGLLIFSKMLPSVAEGNNVWLDEGEKISWLWCSTNGLKRTDYVPDHTTILVLKELIRVVAGPDWQPLHIYFYTKPVKEIGQFLGCDDAKIKFLQKATGLAFPTEMLANRLGRTSNITSFSETAAVFPKTTCDRLEVVLTSFYKSHYSVSIELLAEIVGLSRVTLFRALAKEGVNYRQLVNRVTFKIAADLLENKDLSINEVAQELHYSSTSNFIRAFQRMCGLTPSRYRLMQQKGFKAIH